VVPLPLERPYIRVVASPLSSPPFKHFSVCCFFYFVYFVAVVASAAFAAAAAVAAP